MEEEELIKMRKLLELQRKMLKETSKQKLQVSTVKRDFTSSYEILKEYLTPKAKEILEHAMRQYPSVAKYVVGELARLVLNGRIKEPLNGYTIFHIFQELGYPVRLPTRIVVKRKGETKDLASYLKERIGEEK